MIYIFLFLILFLGVIFNLKKSEILKDLKKNIPNKLLLVAEAFRKKVPFKKIQR